MARGFESKDVEFQQAEAERPVEGRGLTPEERQVADRRRSLELALLRARVEHQTATHPHHRQTLERAIQALEQELRHL